MAQGRLRMAAGVSPSRFCRRRKLGGRPERWPGLDPFWSAARPWSSGEASRFSRRRWTRSAHSPKRKRMMCADGDGGAGARACTNALLRAQAGKPALGFAGQYATWGAAERVRLSQSPRGLTALTAKRYHTSWAGFCFCGQKSTTLHFDLSKTSTRHIREADRHGKAKF